MKTTEPKKWAINPNILHYDIETHSKEWHDFRMRGIGSSEIGIITSASDYGLPQELIESKAGITTKERQMNEAMLSGLLAEESIFTRWRYYDGQGVSYVDNYQKKKQIRDVSQVTGYLVNPKYPHLFTSLDGWASKGSASLIDQQKMPDGFPVEVKTISSFEAKKWIGEVPPSYVFQVNQEMLVTGVDYCELAVLADGQKFQVYPFIKNGLICEIILEKTTEMWALIGKVREMKHEADASPSKSERIYAEIQSLLPLPTDSPLYAQFYSEKMLKSEQAVTVPITNIVFEYAQKRLRIAEAINQMEKHLSFYDNNIKHDFVLAQAEYMESGSDGKVRYYKQENRNNFQLSFTGFKVKPDTKKIEEVVNETVSQILK